VLFDAAAVLLVSHPSIADALKKYADKEAQEGQKEEMD